MKHTKKQIQEAISYWEGRLDENRAELVEKYKKDREEMIELIEDSDPYVILKAFEVLLTKSPHGQFGSTTFTTNVLNRLFGDDGKKFGKKLAEIKIDMYKIDQTPV